MSRISKLPHYLRMYRRRAGLSQEDVAYLLGCHEGTKVCRYERYRRIPTLATALAFEVILGVPVRELFAGIYEKAECEVKRRVGFLARRLITKPGRGTARRLEMLRRLIPPAETQ
jgi:transcriptional regulator with XRE-family HTH domain